MSCCQLLISWRVCTFPGVFEFSECICLSNHNQQLVIYFSLNSIRYRIHTPTNSTEDNFYLSSQTLSKLLISCTPPSFLHTPRSGDIALALKANYKKSWHVALCPILHLFLSSAPECFLVLVPLPIYVLLRHSSYSTYCLLPFSISLTPLTGSCNLQYHPGLDQRQLQYVALAVSLPLCDACKPC